MKNKTSMMNERIQFKVKDWLHQDTQDDDFLLGRTPNNLESTWEDEE
jgi:hypothetical protein